MRHIRHILLSLAMLLGVALGATAQNDPQLTQYWAVPSLYNPSAAGQTDWLRIRGAAKLQWLGIENAPKSFMGTGDMPFKLGKSRLGVGVNIYQESLGLFSNLEVNAQLAYRFKFLKGQLSIGVQGGYFNQKFKGSEVVTPDGDDYHQSTDEAIPTQDLTGNKFDLGAGLMYTHKYFYLGVSGLHLLEPEVNLKQEGTETSEAVEFYSVLPRMLYLTAGSNIPLKNTLFELQPSLLVKTDLTRWWGELTARATYNKMITFGASYRWMEAVSVMVGVEIKNFYVGYAYDYPLSAVNKGSSGSHELVAGYQLKLDFSQKNKNKHRSIRIM